MRIEFESSGGHFPQVIRFVADVSELDSEVAREIERLVADAEFFDFQPDENASSVGPGRDVVEYSLSIVDGDRRNNVEVNDMTAWPGLRSLLTRLRKLGMEKMLRGE